MGQGSLSIRRVSVVRALAGVAILLVLAHVVAGVLDAGKDLFHLGREQTIPALFSAVILLSAALLLAIIGRVSHVGGLGFHHHWYGLSIVFVLLAIDESVEIHERTIEPLRDLLDVSGLLYYAWVIPYVAALLVLVVVYFRFLLALPPKTRNGFILAGSVYVFGAVVVESLTGLVVSSDPGYEGTIRFRALQGAEEVLEIVGIILFISVLLAYIERTLGGINLKLGDVAVPEEQHE